MQETWVMIKHLQQQGVSIRAIARQLGIDRHTVRRALRREGLPKYVYTTRGPRSWIRLNGSIPCFLRRENRSAMLGGRGEFLLTTLGMGGPDDGIRSNPFA
jgi:Homeodomain-like domain